MGNVRDRERDQVNGRNGRHIVLALTRGRHVGNCEALRRTLASRIRIAPEAVSLVRGGPPVGLKALGPRLWGR